jgi:hypothetical protein
MVSVRENAMAPRRSSPLRARATFTVALLGVSLLAACGGGGNAIFANDLDPGAGAGAQRAAMDAALPASYTLHPIRIALADLQLGLGPIINAKGQFIGYDRGRGFVYDPQTDSETIFTDPASSTAFFFPSAINDAGAVSGSVLEDGVNGTRHAAFYWSPATGSAVIRDTSGDVVQTFLSNDGIVGGYYPAFRWNSLTSMLQEFPSFKALSMNNAGSMFGAVNGEAAILLPDGTTRPLLADGPVPATDAGLIADGDVVFTGLRQEIGGLKPGAIVVSDGHAMNIGFGLVAIPPGATESSSISRISSNGHAIGTNYPSSTLPNCLGSRIGPEVPFHWFAGEGASPITVDNGGPLTTLIDVNRSGVVLGHTGTPDGKFQRAFVWTKASGSILLDSLVPDLPPNTHLINAEAIGDGGHILAYRLGDATGWVVLMPNP